jgi:hypothetical protein
MRPLLYSPDWHALSLRVHLYAAPFGIFEFERELVNERKTRRLFRFVVSGLPTATVFAVMLLCIPVYAQSTASIEGQINDQHGAVVTAVEITIVSLDIGIRRIAVTDADGRYQISALPVGSYRIEVKSHGFGTQIIESLTLEVGRRSTQNFQLRVGDVAQKVTVPTNNDLLEQSSVSIDHVVD